MEIQIGEYFCILLKNTKKMLCNKKIYCVQYKYIFITNMKEKSKMFFVEIKSNDTFALDNKKYETMDLIALNFKIFLLCLTYCIKYMNYNRKALIFFFSRF